MTTPAVPSYAVWLCFRFPLSLRMVDDGDCGAAKRQVMPSVEHRKHKGLNNRAENSHQPTRR